MITLLRWAFWVCALGAMVWFAATVPLGTNTLIGHLRAIAATKEARSLAEGARNEAEKAAERARQQLNGETDDAKRSEPPPAGSKHAERPPASGSGEAKAPTDRLDQRDRERLDRLVRERTGAAHPLPPAH